MPLRLELRGFLAQPLNLERRRLHLPVPGKGMLRVGGQVPDPFAQQILMEIKIAIHGQPSLPLAEPYRLDREDGAYSPVEIAIRQALESG